MGTDIHAVWQKKTPDGWEDVESEWEQRRHYQLFAILADVRNGFGFAGVVTGEPIVPISEPRGLPDDFKLDTFINEDDEEEADIHYVSSLNVLPPRLRKYYADSKPYRDMGDHSFSWLTGTEILEWFETPPKIKHFGVITREQYLDWDGKSSPSEYCGDVWGQNIIMFDSTNKDTVHDWTHIRVSWEADMATDMKYFLDEVRRLIGLHGEIRLVFGFDS